MALAAAFAFTEKRASTGVFGQASGVWYDVTGIPPSSSSYLCESGGTGCLYDQPHGMGQVISPNPNQNFSKRGDLPLAD